MAITVQETRETRYGYGVETAFGTAVADNGAFNEVACESFNFDLGVIVDEVPQNGGTRMPIQQTTQHSTQGSAAMFSVTGPITLRDIDHIMYAHFQDVVENAGTLVKTFTPCTTQPDFSSNEGHFLTWVKRMPIASTSEKATSAICTRLKVSAERDGYYKFDTDWIGLGTSLHTSNPSGAWIVETPSTLIRFNDISVATLSHGSSLGSPFNLILHSFEIETKYDVEKVGQSASNGFATFGMKGLTGSWKISVLRGNSSITEAIASIKAGEMVQLVITAPTLTITIDGKIDTHEDAKDGLLMTTISGTMFAPYETGAVTLPVTYVLDNDIDRNWPAS